MNDPQNWRQDLKTLVGMMRDLSRQNDPQEAAVMYGQRLRATGFMPMDERMSVSRRNLSAPQYRITRNSRWSENINPWKEPEKLPVYSTGMLGEMIYSDEPAIFEDLPSSLKKGDPLYDQLCDFKMMITLPQFDGGEALNMNVILMREGSPFPLEKLPTMFWLSNLWGRAVSNLVLRKELQTSHEQLQGVNKALERELGIVGEIQRGLLPLKLPDIPGLHMAAHYQTSQRAGGDYYDIFDCGDGTWGILIADVSGHGAPAAVIMAITHAIAHLHPGKGTPPGELLTFVNSSLARRYTVGNGSFVTAFYGLYDCKTRRLRYARAGHNPPRLMRKCVIGSLEGDGGLPLGLIEDLRYCEATVVLEPGDMVMLYTDGIVEARSRDGEMFDVERLDKAIGKGGLKAERSLEEVLSALDAFTGGAALLDDRTLLAVAVQ